MKTLNYLQLDPKGTETTVEGLQKLLANCSYIMQTLEDFTGMLRGSVFGAHENMKSIMTKADHIDEVAERILMLGGVPSHNFSEYQKLPL